MSGVSPDTNRYVHGNAGMSTVGGSAMSHDVFRDTEGGFSCRRCSLWARFRSMFDWLSCPPE